MIVLQISIYITNIIFYLFYRPATKRRKSESAVVDDRYSYSKLPVGTTIFTAATASNNIAATATITKSNNSNFNNNSGGGVYSKVNNSSSSSTGCNNGGFVPNELDRNRLQFYDPENRLLKLLNGLQHVPILLSL